MKNCHFAQFCHIRTNIVLPALTLSRVANKGRKWVLTENLKLVLLQFTGNKIGLSRFTKKKTFLTRIYVIYDFTVAFVVSSLENPQCPQGSSNEKTEETADESAPMLQGEVGSSANFLLGGSRKLSKLPPWCTISIWMSHSFQ